MSKENSVTIQWERGEFPHQDASSNNASHEFDLICKTVESLCFLLGINGLKIREEQKNVADYGQQCQRIKADANKLGALSCTHDVNILIKTVKDFKNVSLSSQVLKWGEDGI